MPSWLTTLDHCPSTNSWALDHLHELAHGDCVFTRQQTAGRGQAGRQWISDPGVLTASWVLRLERPADGPALSLAAGLALAHAIEDALPAATSSAPPLIQIKWPNDAYARGRKLAGILCEARSLRGGLAAVIGIGCNVDPAWGDQPPAEAATGRVPPISLRSLIDPPPTMPELLTTIRRYLLEAAGLIAAGNFPALLPELRRRNWLAERMLRVDWGNGPQLVRCCDLDELGRLVVLLGDGGHRALDSSRHLLDVHIA